MHTLLHWWKMCFDGKIIDEDRWISAISEFENWFIQIGVLPDIAVRRVRHLVPQTHPTFTTK